MVVGAPSGKLNMFMYKVTDCQSSEICILPLSENYSFTCITNTHLCKMNFNRKQQEITTEHNTLAIPLQPPPLPPPQTNVCLQELKNSLQNKPPFYPVCPVSAHDSLSSCFETFHMRRV